MTSLRRLAGQPTCAVLGALCAWLFVGAAHAGAQTGSTPKKQQPSSPDPAVTFNVTVVGTTPLPGVELPPMTVPAPVQVATADAIEASGAVDLSDFLNRRFNGVFVNEVQNNPFQPDLNYRGYTASPLLGTPQGLSLYLDGVRLNQPFGEIVSWDLVPRIAIASSTLLAGSNPLFGLNTLGGALSLRTKDGRSHPGTTLQASYGSDVRRALEFEHGGQVTSGAFDWYLAGQLFAEDGWREDSPSDVRQFFGKIGWRGDRNELALSLVRADNALTGNGLQDHRLLGRDYGSIYTKPDTTENRSTLVTVTAARAFRPSLTLIASASYRSILTDTLNGDINEESLDQALYEPSAAERAALEAAGYGVIPERGLNAGNNPFPSLRCIANVLLNDEPSETCNGLINRTDTTQRIGAVSGQLTHRRAMAGGVNVFMAGAAVERSTIRFGQSTQLGYLTPDRGVAGLNAFGDGVTGGEADDEPYDTRVDLAGTVSTLSVFATDTLPVGNRTHLTLSGRFDRTTVENVDRIKPGGGPGSLDGRHTFGRFKPAVGVTFDLRHATNLYGQYSEGSRAATSIELGCADPEEPCKLPNAMAGDPPLTQVVTRTVEAGVRGSITGLTWHAGVFRATNRDDILFVMAERTGFGYFRNFGGTRRHGLELGVNGASPRMAWGAGYTWLRATFASEETVNGESNSSNDAAINGGPGLEGAIDIGAGDRMPLVPGHLFKAFAELAIKPRLGVDVNLVGSGKTYVRGNENNQHQPDGTYYLGEGTVDGYAIVNAGVRFAITERITLTGQITNLFDLEYATAGQLGPAGFTESGAFVARPFPVADGEFPVRHTTFLAPGAPRRARMGVRVRF